MVKPARNHTLKLSSLPQNQDCQLLLSLRKLITLSGLLEFMNTVTLSHPEDTVLLHTPHPTFCSYILYSVFSAGSYQSFPVLVSGPVIPELLYFPSEA